MKRLFIFFAFSLLIVSCKKDRACTCVTTTTDVNGITTGPAVKTNFIYVTKKTAKANCVSSSWSDASGLYSKTCTLD